MQRGGHGDPVGRGGPPGDPTRPRAARIVHDRPGCRPRPAGGAERRAALEDPSCRPGRPTHRTRFRPTASRVGATAGADRRATRPFHPHHAPGDEPRPARRAPRAVPRCGVMGGGVGHRGWAKGIVTAGPGYLSQVGREPRGRSPVQCGSRAAGGPDDRHAGHSPDKVVLVWGGLTSRTRRRRQVPKGGARGSAPPHPRTTGAHDVGSITGPRSSSLRRRSSRRPRRTRRPRTPSRKRGTSSSRARPPSRRAVPPRRRRCPHPNGSPIAASRSIVEAAHPSWVATMVRSDPAWRTATIPRSMPAGPESRVGAPSNPAPGRPPRRGRAAPGQAGDRRRRGVPADGEDRLLEPCPRRADHIRNDRRCEPRLAPGGGDESGRALGEQPVRRHPGPAAVRDLAIDRRMGQGRLRRRGYRRGGEAGQEMRRESGSFRDEPRIAPHAPRPLGGIGADFGGPRRERAGCVDGLIPERRGESAS